MPIRAQATWATDGGPAQDGPTADAPVATAITAAYRSMTATPTACWTACRPASRGTPPLPARGRTRRASSSRGCPRRPGRCDRDEQDGVQPAPHPPRQGKIRCQRCSCAGSAGGVSMTNRAVSSPNRRRDSDLIRGGTLRDYRRRPLGSKKTAASGPTAQPQRPPKQRATSS